MKPLAAAATGYPATTAAGRAFDPSRRRFLRQLAAGGSALGVAGALPSEGVAQQPVSPDFSILAEHQAAPAPAESGRRTAMARERRQRGEGDAEGSAAPARTSETWITENRALWVDPAYLLLLQWSRPETDVAPVEALEGATEAVAAYLGGAGATSEALHDPARLDAIEQGVLAVLAPRVSPAVIEVLHLDHDCRAVCPSVDPGPMIRGRMAPPIR